jgi:type III secretory pathway component EscV
MRQSSNLGLFAIAVAIAVVGALALGVPVGTLAVLAIVAVCPLMMLAMMRTMHGDHSDHSNHSRHDQTIPRAGTPATTNGLTARGA